MDPLPAWLDGIAFSVREGRAHGLTDGRMRHPSFARPFHGVRVTGSSGRVDGGIIDRCSDLATILPPSARFSHATAALLWGMPLPAGLDDRLHVVSVGGAPLRRRGVIGWTRPAGSAEVVAPHDLPLSSPAETWVELAGMTPARGGVLSRERLVAVGDHIVSGVRVRGGRATPLASLDDLRGEVSRHGSGRGAVALRWAVDRVRSPVDSPQETLLRLGLVRAGLPEPIPQPPVATRGGVRHPDLAYLTQRVLLEYLGDVHRTDPATWRRDLTRIQEFEDAGYRTIVVGAADLTPAGLHALAQRVRRALR